MASLDTTQIGWQNYEAAGIISREQLEMLYCYDKQPISTQVALFKQRGEDYVELFVVLLQNVNREETVQYVLALLDDLLVASPQLGLFWHELLRNSGAEVDPFAPIMRLLGRTNGFILEKAAVVLGRILSLKPRPLIGESDAGTEADEVTKRHLRTFTEWIFHQLNTAHSLDMNECPKLHYALSAMMALLTTDVGRLEVADMNGVAMIVQVLTRATAAVAESAKPTTVQLIYQLTFCLWCLSYNQSIAHKMVTAELAVIPLLVKCIPVKEKVARVCLMTLKNLLGSGKGAANDQMVSAGIMRLLEQMGTRRWADEDISEDISELSESLETDVASLSTFDVFKAEVLSGSLEWSPSHKNPQFWKENVAKFGEGNYQVVSALVDMIKSPNTSTTTLAVACYDLGAFIQHHPDGRKVVSSFGAKQPLMELLAHSDGEVQKQALTCTQKLMVTNWEMLAK